MKYLPAIWNALVVAVLGYVILMFQYHLIWNPLALYRDHFDEYSLKGIVNGPVYISLFAAFAIHCSTLFMRWSFSRKVILVVSTILPLSGMTCVVAKTGWEPDYVVPLLLLVAADVLVVLAQRPFWATLLRLKPHQNASTKTRTND